MKKLIHSLLLVVFMALPFMAQAQQQVTIRELNTYDIELNDEEDLLNHPLVGVDVTFTAMLITNPRTSGNATFDTNDGSIGRVHMFVVDTTALNDSVGRDGMYMQIVESELDLVENLTRGTIYTFRGELEFFSNEPQVDLTEAPVEVTSVNPDDFAPLLEPWVVDPAELNVNNNGTFSTNLDNYEKYNAAYVKLENVQTRVVAVGERPDWAVESSSALVVSDFSLRYRNDWLDNYRDGYNFRRSETTQGKQGRFGEGPFVPPAAGSIVNISGFVIIDSFDPFGFIENGREIFAINPFEDGVLWTQDSTKFVNGDDLGNGQIFEWPNDLEILSSPPQISNVTFDPDVSVFPANQDIGISADIIAGTDGETVTGVKIFFAEGTADEDSLVMNLTTGSTYEATLPGFTDKSSVSYRIEATQSNGFVGTFPIIGSNSFFVSDDPLTSIEVVQRTPDDSTGTSPLADAGVLPVDITATVVVSAAEGPIVVHDGNGPFSGIFLERTSETTNLEVGDEITITSTEVREINTSGGDQTQLFNLAFTVNSSGNDVSGLIPSLLSDDVIAFEKDGEIEPWEGMLITFENAIFIEEGGFGEFTIANKSPDSTNFPTDGIIVNEDIRSTLIGETGFPDDLNIHVRDTASFSSVTGIMVSSFGDHKLVPRSLSDVAGNANWTFPILSFDLNGPADSAEVIVDGDINVDWAGTTDYDGDDLTYEWVLYAAADTSEIVTVSAGSATEVLLTFETVDGLLESAGLNVGDTADFLWNVRVSDGGDTLDVASGYDFNAQQYETTYRFLTLERAEATSNEDGELGLPKVFSLDQNYPNPFNPSTNINFALPQAAKVSLTIYDMLGRKVATLLNEQRPAGRHTVQFDASSLASGMYIYRIEAASFTSTKKMLLIK